jgi:hypothetical protein
MISRVIRTNNDFLNRKVPRRQVPSCGHRMPGDLRCRSCVVDGCFRRPLQKQGCVEEVQIGMLVSEHPEVGDMFDRDRVTRLQKQPGGHRSPCGLPVFVSINSIQKMPDSAIHRVTESVSPSVSTAAFDALPVTICPEAVPGETTAGLSAGCSAAPPRYLREVPTAVAAGVQWPHGAGCWR